MNSRSFWRKSLQRSVLAVLVGLIATLFLCIGSPPAAHAGFWSIQTTGAAGSARFEASQIAFDGGGKGHLTYIDPETPALKYITNLSGSWAAQVIDTDISGSIGTAGIAVDAKNKVHIVYRSKDTKTLKHATNLSGSWVIETVATNSLGFGDAKIAVDAKNKLHIGTQQTIDANTLVLYHYTNTSGSWAGSEADKKSGRNYGKYLSVAIDLDNAVLIAHTETTGSLRLATNRSGSWTATCLDNCDAGNSAVIDRYSAIAIDANNKYRISFTTTNPDALKVYTEGAGVQIIDKTEARTYRDATGIVVTGEDVLHISYIQYDSASGQYYLKYATNKSGEWITRDVLNTTSPDSFTDNAIDLDPQSNPGIVFTRSDAKLAYYCSHESIELGSSTATAVPEGGEYEIPVAIPTCYWSATSNVPWIAITAGQGQGDGAVICTVAKNTGDVRTGTITIGDKALTITQSAGTKTDEGSLGTVAVLIGGSGTVTSSPAGISCGETCDAQYAKGSTVTLTAVPDAGYVLNSWVGCDSTTGSECAVTVTPAKSVSVSFKAGYTLTASVNGAGKGMITSLPAGINCESSCTAGFDPGASVTLTATPAPGFTFSSWSGCDSTAGNTCTVAIEAAKSVVASFDQPLSLPVKKLGAGERSLSAVNQWTTLTVSGTGNNPYMYMATAVMNDLVYFFGGRQYQDNGCDEYICSSYCSTTPQTLEYNPSSNTRQAKANVPAALYGASAVRIDDKIYVHGGAEASTQSYACTITSTKKTLYTYTPATNTWAGVLGEPNQPRYLHTAVVINGKMYVYGGMDTLFSCWDYYACSTTTAPLNDLWEYNPSTNQWTQKANGPGTRYKHTAVAINGKMYVFGGATNTGAANTLHEYNPATNTWAQLSPSGSLPTKRYDHAAAVIDNKMYIYGGQDLGVAKRDTWEYDPSSNAWTQKTNGQYYLGGNQAATVNNYMFVGTTNNLIYRYEGPVPSSYQITVGKTGTGAGTITSNPAGISCGATCSYNYNSGTSITLTASPDTNSTFSGWSGGGCSGTGTCVITADAAKTVTATFALKTYTITTSPGANGSITPVNPTVNYGANQTLTITANTGYHIDTLTVDGSVVTAASSYTFTNVTAAHTIAATFVINTHAISASKTGDGAGTITSSPVGIDCGATCSANYDQGTSVTLTATAATGSTFGSWTGCDSTSGNACTVSVTAAKSVSASFTLNAYAVTISKSGSGTGTITSSPAGISCGATCSYDFKYGTSVTLTAVPDASSTFTGWSGGGCSGTGTCVFTVSGATTVTPTFGLKTYTITTTAGSNGTITPSSPSVNYGTNQSFTITPNSGYHIADVTWDGVSVGAVTSYTATNVTATHTLAATFEINNYKLTASRAGNGAGSINSSPVGISCGSTCSYNFNHGTSVTLMATPDASSTFAGWSGGGCSGTGSCQVTADAAKTVTATFALKTYTITPMAGSNGSISPSLATMVNYGASQAFTFEPAAHHHIADVKVNGTSIGTPASYTFSNVTGNHTIEVTFAVDTVAVTASAGEHGSISPNGSVQVNYGSEQNYAIIPDPGYHVADVVVDSVSQGALSSYKFTNVTEPHTIAATFVINTYKITTTPGVNGTITPANPAVNHGSDQAFTISAANGYHITDVVVDGISKGVITSYTFTNITAVHTISATFAINSYALTVSKGGDGSGAVTSSPGTISCGATCSNDFNHGTSVALTAAAATGSTFGSWTGCDSVSGNTCTVNVTAAKSVIANFTLNSYVVTVTKSGNGTGTVSGNLIDCGATCSGSIKYGTQVTLTAVPDVSSTFTEWSGGGCSGTENCVFTVTGDVTVTPAFTLKGYTITTSAGANGTIFPANPSVNYGGNQTISINGNTGYHVVDVVVDGVSKGAVTSYAFSNVTTNHTISAVFAINTNPVTATAEANGSISPSGTVNVDYNANQTFTISAANSHHISDVVVDGVSQGAITSYTFSNVTAVHTIAASFAINTYTLGVSTAGDGTGTITGSQSGISCPGSCSATYNHGDSITLTATAATGSTFGSWTGCDSVSGNTCTVNMTAAKSVAANFILNTYTVTVQKSGTGIGVVSSSPEGINCGSDCSYVFKHGTSVTLNRTPDGSSTFSGWSGGGCSGVNACTVTVTGDITVTAGFALKTFTITTTTGANGSITPVNPKITYGGSQTFAITPNAGYHTVNVAVDGIAKGVISEYTLENVTAAHTITAIFAINKYNLVVEKTGNGSGTVAGGTVNCGATCTVSYNHGSSVTLSATPGAGSVFTGWSGACTGTGSCALTITDNTVATANFDLKTYTITPVAGPNGTITPETAPGVNHGGSQVFTFTPSAHYHVADVKVNGVSVGPSSSYTFSDVTSDQSIEVSFEIDSSTITASAGEHGSITPAGSTVVGYGGSQTYTITPDQGYRILDVMVDGKSMGKAATYTFPNVTANHTISATFIAEYAVTATKGGNGSGTVTGTAINCGTACSSVYESGSSLVLTAMADANSTFGGWKGACSGTNTTCTVTVDSAKSVTAVFNLKTYTITATAGENGSVTPSGPVTVNYGTNQVFTVSPSAGYHIATLAIDGVNQTIMTGTYTFSNVTGDHTISATFAPNTFAVIVTKSGNGTGMISSSPQGISCGQACTYEFNSGSMVTLTAIPDAGSDFTGWSGACTGSETTCAVTVDQVKEVSAVFTTRTYTVTITAGPHGSVSPAGKVSVNHGENISMTLTADAGYHVADIRVNGASVGSSNTYTLSNITSDASVDVSFAPNMYSLSLTRSGTGQGSLTTEPAGIDCGSICSAQFGYGTIVAVIPAPGIGSHFAGWKNGCSGNAGCSLTITGASAVEAVFDLNAYTITASAGAHGTISPSGTTSVNYGGTQTYTIQPAENYRIDSLTVDGSPVAPAASYTFADVDANHTITVTFTPVTRSFTMNRIGNGTGVVTSLPAGINCGDVCSATFDHGTVLTLTAAPVAGSNFSGWSSCESASGNTCTTTVTGLAGITASFTLDRHVVAIIKTGEGMITSTSGAISCGTACSENFDYGTVPTLTAVPDTGWLFSKWTGCDTVSGAQCSFSVAGSREIKAEFVREKYAVMVTKTGQGSVASQDGGIDCGSACRVEYEYGSTITLTATPAMGAHFMGWTGACTGSSTTCSIPSLSEAKTVNAVFEIDRFVITASATGHGRITPAGTSTVNYGDRITHTIIPDTGYHVESILINGTPVTAAKSYTFENVTANASIAVSFAPNTYRVDVTLEGEGQGNVVAEPAGIDCVNGGGACSALYSYGQTVVLSAAPARDSAFMGWSGACAGSSTTICQLTIENAKSVSAIFTPLFAFKVTRDGHGGVVSDDTTVACAGNTCLAHAPKNSMVTLRAVPDTGHRFVAWSGVCLGNGMCRVQMDSPKAATAIFEPQAEIPSATYTVTIAKTGQGAGTIYVDGTPYTNGTTLVTEAGRVVRVTVTPASGSIFKGWTGACLGTGGCTVTVNSDTSMTAQFDINAESPIGGQTMKYTLTLNIGTGGSALVNGVPYSQSSALTFDSGAVLTVIPVPAANHVFSAWSGACFGTGGCRIILGSNKTVGITFAEVEPEPPVVYNLTVTKKGTGAGSVVADKGGVSCGSDCSGIYESGTAVKLIATPEPGSVFTGWSGACLGTGACNTTMSKDRNVTATFTAK